MSIITWTVTDIHGNTGTCQTTVTVNAPVNSSIDDVYAVNPGGAANTLYTGYGLSSITLNATVSGGKVLKIVKRQLPCCLFCYGIFIKRFS